MVNKKRQSTVKVPIFVFKPKRFNRTYGKKVQAVTESCSSKKKECEIHIRSGFSRKRFNKIVNHEIGHIVTEKARIASKINQKERKILRQLAKRTLPKRRFEHKREPNREILAIIYERLKEKNKSQTKVIDSEVPKTAKLIREAIRKIKIKREIIRLKNGK